MSASPLRRVRGARRIVVGVGGSATTDGGLGAVETLGWSLAGIDVIVACDVTTHFVDAARVFAPQKGATDAAGRVADAAGWCDSPSSSNRAPVSTCVRSTARVRPVGSAGGLAAIGARLEPGFDVVAGAAGFDAALDGADFVLTGEGKVDATSFAGKVVGGVFEWTADVGIPHRGVIGGQVTAEARDEISVLGAWVDALTDRVWQSGEAFTRAALLVEESALDLARRASRSARFWRHFSLAQSREK